MSEQFYIRHGGRVQGPFPVQKLHEMFRRGRFSRAYQVSTDRLNWQRAGELPDLFPAAPSTGRSPRAAPIGSPLDADPESMPPADAQLPESAAYALQANVPSRASGAGSLWHYTSHDVEQAPVPLAQLLDRVRAGGVLRSDQVWSEGMSDWMTASQVPELRDHFPSAGMNAWGGIPSGHQTASAASAGHTQTAPMAVASLVLGLLGTNLLFFLGSILAVIFGHIAVGQIRESGGRLGGHGLAIAGLVFGYAVIVITVVVGILVLLIALLAAFAAPEL